MRASSCHCGCGAQPRPGSCRLNVPLNKHVPICIQAQKHRSGGWFNNIVVGCLTSRLPIISLRLSTSKNTTSKTESNVTQPPNNVNPTTTMTDASRSHHSRRKRSHRRKPFSSDDAPLEIRVGNRRVSGHFVQIQATSGADAGRFDRMVDDTIRSNPRDPITM